MLFPHETRLRELAVNKVFAVQQENFPLSNLPRPCTRKGAQMGRATPWDMRPEIQADTYLHTTLIAAL